MVIGRIIKCLMTNGNSKTIFIFSHPKSVTIRIINFCVDRSELLRNFSFPSICKDMQVVFCVFQK